MTNQFHNHFGIRLTGEFVSQILKFASQLVCIIQSAIVHESNLSGTICMRMGIFIRLSPMGRPTSMCNPNWMSCWSCTVLSDKFNGIRLVSVGSKFSQYLRGKNKSIRSIPMNQKYSHWRLPWDHQYLAWWRVQRNHSHDSLTQSSPRAESPYSHEHWPFELASLNKLKW
jgi:hypothetical protein